MDKEILTAIIKLSRYVIAISSLFCIAIFATVLNIYLGTTPSVKVGTVQGIGLASSSSAIASADAKPLKVEKAVWIAPDTSAIPNNAEGKQIKYGRELIAHTSTYFGPKGSVAAIANNMNCQNCHNEAGTKPYGLNYSAVASTYPQFKTRSNTWVSIAMRINGCFQRSMNGKPLDSTSHEMKAMISYMKWLGKDVAKGIKPEGAGVEKLAFLDRAADPLKGQAVFLNTCQSCHGKNGEGLVNAGAKGYTYPPLWGKNSYNDGAGLYRITTFAGFAKNNMPFGIDYQHPVLKDEEAWDVAAFVNSQPRPHKDQSKDWKNIAKKPIDFPFGPYADQFSEKQHKLGPFKAIKAAQKSKSI
jgi:thiosulfate dehydrogenase